MWQATAKSNPYPLFQQKVESGEITSGTLWLAKGSYAVVIEEIAAGRFIPKVGWNQIEEGHFEYESEEFVLNLQIIRIKLFE